MKPMGLTEWQMKPIEPSLEKIKTRNKYFGSKSNAVFIGILQPKNWYERCKNENRK